MNASLNPPRQTVGKFFGHSVPEWSLVLNRRLCVTGNCNLIDGANPNDRPWAALYKNLLNVTKAVFVSSFICLMFKRPYFHLPHAIMFICIALPFGSPCYSILLVRLGLASASIVQLVFADKIQHWIDSMLWNFAFAVIHIMHIFVLFYQLKTKKFNEELEEVNDIIIIFFFLLFILKFFPDSIKL